MDNYEMNQVLHRYNLAKPHTLVYSYEELKALGVEPEFIFALLHVFENKLEFNSEMFRHFPLPVIIDYLRKTHRYYLTKKLLEIEQSIHHLATNYPLTHPLLLILNTFYTDYRNHLTRHIEVEETKLLPYIEYLISKERGEVVDGQHYQSYSLKNFFDQHHDTEKDLEEVRRAMVQYSPPPSNQTMYRILLSQLQVLEKDLAIHALIEDEVLIPRAIELELKVSGNQN